MMAAKKPTIMRVRIAREELEKMSKEDLHKCWNLQDQYVDLLENKLNTNSEHTELLSLRESEEKLKQQQLEASRRENILVMRLTTKEHEMQEFAGQIQELKQAQVPSIAQLRSALLDPAVNLLFERMRKEMDSLKARLKEIQDEMNAWKFTPDSNTGKRLMSKCRLLYQENEELGKIISSGRMAKLEGDLALQKSFSEEMKKSQSELDEFLLELDEDVEGMQSTIYYLQQQLREAKEQIQQLQKDQSDPCSISNGSPANQSSVQGDSSSIKVFSPGVQTEVALPVTSTPKFNGTESKTNINATDTSKSLHLSKDPVIGECLSMKQPAGSVIKSTIVNKIVNHDKNPIQPKRTNIVVDSSDSAAKTNDHVNDLNRKTESSDLTREKADSLSIKNSKKTPDKGRKRNRPRTPESINEENLPVRKRTRRREAELLKQEAEENRTEMDIDTDTEVQVAQTLASWASTKQERTEVKTDLDTPLGNGEIRQNNEDLTD